MAIIIDPDDLNQSTAAASGSPDGEVYLDPTASPPTIELISSTDGYGGSNLIAADGATLQALYSFLKEEWKSDAALIKYPFPMEAITSEQFEFINDWELDDTTTASRTYVRFGGWTEKDASAVVKQEYMSVITLGNFFTPASQKAYYYWTGDTTKTDFTYFGPVNEAVQIYGDASNGDFDNRTTVLSVAIRPDPTGSTGNVEGYTFDLSTTTDIGASSVTYQAYRFPLSSVVDLNISLTDAEVGSLETAKSITLEWYDSDQASDTFLPFDLAGGPYNFRVIVNDDGTATTDEFYNWVQWALRQGDTDIDDGTAYDGGYGAGIEYAFATAPLVEFVGSTLQTFDIDTSASYGGVAIDGFDTNYANDIKMTDNGGTRRSFPYVAAGKLIFNTNLIEDASAKFWVFFTNDDAPGDNNGYDFGTADAMIVDDNATDDITGPLHYQAFSPATGNGSGTTGATTAASAVFTVSGESWTVDDLIGQVLVVDEGDETVDGSYWIVDNDATTITVDRPFEGTLSDIDWSIKTKNAAGEIVWDFDYTNNVQRGSGSGDSDAPVTIVAIGLETAQYVVATATIAKATGQNFSVTSALERNYSDPN